MVERPQVAQAFLPVTAFAFAGEKSTARNGCATEGHSPRSNAPAQDASAVGNCA